MMEVLEESDDSETRDLKKLCRSLGLSGNCQQLGDINLSSESEESEWLRFRLSSDISLDISLLIEETDDGGNPVDCYRMQMNFWKKY